MCTPAPLEITCSFLIQLVFCRRKLWFLGVEVKHEIACVRTPPLSPHEKWGVWTQAKHETGLNGSSGGAPSPAYVKILDPPLFPTVSHTSDLEIPFSV